MVSCYPARKIVLKKAVYLSQKKWKRRQKILPLIQIKNANTSLLEG